MDNKEKTPEIEDRKLGRKAIGPWCRQSNRERERNKNKGEKTEEKEKIFESECEKGHRKRNQAKDKVKH